MVDFPNVISERLRLWRHGRDAYVHRILTVLFLGRSPDPWNNPSRLSHSGARLLKSLDEVLFGEEWGTPEQFYWEYKLPKRPEDTQNGWPDFAALWTERVLLFELRTESGRHRDATVDWYLKLAAHNHNGRAVDIVYLTPDPINGRAQDLPDLARVRNCSFSELAKVIEVAWGKASGSEAVNAMVFAQFLKEVGTAQDSPAPPLPVGARATKSKRKIPGEDPPALSFPKPVWNRILDTLVETLEDGYGRALDLPVNSTEEAKEIRRKVRADLEVGEWLGDAGRKLELWIWNQDSGGDALSDCGETNGVEIRVSKAR